MLDWQGYHAVACRMLAMDTVPVFVHWCTLCYGMHMQNVYCSLYKSDCVHSLSL